MASPASSFLQTLTPPAQAVAFGIGPAASRPIQPVNGFLYSDTTLNILVQWNGSAWLTLGQIAPAQPFGIGPTGQRPVGQAAPYFYLDTTLNQLVVYTGSTWLVIGPIAAPAPPTIAPPQITAQPISQTVAASSSVTFTVTATGTGSLAYQWSFNGVAIGGATSASYNIASAAQSNGGTYTVTVTGSGGSTTSMGALLTVTGSPYIITQPSSQTINVGASVTFTVVATGSAPLTYQWFLNSLAINGATSSNYTIGAVSVSQGGNYQCVVTNGSGSATSSAAILTVTNTGGIGGTPYQGYWTSFFGTGVTSAGSSSATGSVFFGFVLGNANAGASNVNFQLTTSNGAFPPGVTWALYNNGVVIQNGSSVGGEASIGASLAVASVASGLPTYTIIVSYSSWLTVQGTISVVSGPMFLINSSVRSTIYGALLFPPGGANIYLQTSTAASGSILQASFYAANGGNYLNQPNAWSFNGNSLVPNPSTSLQPIGSTVTLQGSAPPSGGTDCVLELDGVAVPLHGAPVTL